MTRPSPQTDRVVALVELLTAHPDQPWTLAEVTRRLAVNKSTAHSMLTALHSAGWLLRDPSRKTYRLGPALVAVGQVAAAGFPALDFARPVMASLVLELGVHCTALAVSDDRATVLHQVADGRGAPPGLREGTAYPLRPPFGSAVVAWADARAVSRWLAHVPAERHAQYREALAATRRRGYAVELSAPPAGQLLEVLSRWDGAADASVATVRELLDDLAARLVDQGEFLAAELDPDRTYAVTVVNAPVLGDDDQAVLVLALTGFGPLSGRRIEEVGQRLAAATAELTAALARPPRAR